MSKYLISLILLSVISMGVSAQRITRQYNNVSFSAALKDLNARQDKYVINFVYDELEDFKVTKNIQNESVPDAIMNLIGFYNRENEMCIFSKRNVHFLCFFRGFPARS